MAKINSKKSEKKVAKKVAPKPVAKALKKNVGDALTVVRMTFKSGHVPVVNTATVTITKNTGGMFFTDGKPSRIRSSLVENPRYDNMHDVFSLYAVGGSKEDAIKRLQSFAVERLDKQIMETGKRKALINKALNS